MPRSSAKEATEVATTNPGPGLECIAGEIYLYRDACNVYVLRQGREAVLVDLGAGDVLDHLAELGVERVTDVLLTHHHRDQGQGLPRAVQAGARIWVPETEQHLVRDVEAHWQARELYNNYNTRQDRFSLLEPVPIAGTLADYEFESFAGRAIQVLPTPGHTTGSVSLVMDEEGRRLAFSGDLIAAPGKVWSLAATQWTYNGAEGLAASIASLLDLRGRGLDRLLPSHGEPIAPVGPAIDLLVERLWRLIRERRGLNQRLLLLHQEPYVRLTPHLLFNRSSMANSYVLLSDSGGALVIDFGYDFCTGVPAGADRAARRPWLYTLPALKRDLGVDRIEVVLPTHAHDDHVAGFNLLRRVEGSQVWAAENLAGILEEPGRYDLPCLWPEPIAVDRRLPLERGVRWHEYEISLYPQPGHARQAVAVAFEVDGVRVLATGDQYQDDDSRRWNYVYQNGFEPDDYARSAALWAHLRPELILPGHWAPLWVPPGYLDDIQVQARSLAALHRDLLPAGAAEREAGLEVRLEPYQAVVRGGEGATFEVLLTNPAGDGPRAAERARVCSSQLDCSVPSAGEEVAVRPVVPAGWQVEPQAVCVHLPAEGSAAASFAVTPPAGLAVRRARIAVDVSRNGRRLGQLAEALVTVR